jgi:spore germination cell wall hydrolase CwlJ-like protein
MMTAKIIFLYILGTTNFASQGIDVSKIDPEQAYCLAKNIYYEAGNEDIRGQFAVASVTLNRVKDSQFPNTVCNVVKYSIKTKNNKAICAFSWYCTNERKGKDVPIINKNGTINQTVVDQFQIASVIAISVLGSKVADNTYGATFFHNASVHPSWVNTLTKTAKIGNHTFYK